jgi:hypothetical protein
MNTLIRKNDVPGWVTGAFADELFRHLETKPNLIQSKRVAHMLNLLSRLGKNEGDWPAFTHLREPLKRYQWRYGLTLSSSGLQARLEFTKEMSDKDEWEHKAVRFLLSLVPHHLNRLRRCAYDGCNGWFFAEKREDQKFCKRGACRQNYYDSDKERRERKKEKMRENRKWHREQARLAKARLAKEGRKETR